METPLRTRRPSKRRASKLPSGTITFLFSDIEGSTHLWEDDHAVMQSAVRRHDVVMRSAITANEGCVFKTVGDAFCAAFALPGDAVAAALEAQRALALEGSGDQIRVRMALHTGTADERDGDYFGPTLNRVARLLAIGHGGQVLISAVTSELMQDKMPPKVTLEDLGAHRLRDLARPEHVYELRAPDLPNGFPPLRSLDALPNNLPLQLTSFVAREKEVDEITALLSKHRLVTLVGAGGIGKTRISLRVAANMLDTSADGVWFVELAPLTDPTLVPSTIAKALHVTLPAEGDVLEALARSLKVKRLLIVLDNCEHLLGAAAAAASMILRNCPKVTILASSRQGLAITGEAVYRMPSLAMPNVKESATLRAHEATTYGAIALFVARAEAADARFRFTDENAPIVADICRRLDGIAFAIELAAARVGVLNPHELRARLDQRFRVLTGGARDALPRRQTLRALIDWSYDLLDERERALFRRIGIFVDGFTLIGGLAVSGGEVDELELFDVLASLVDKSLVIAEGAHDSTRYRLLESTRAYACEKLDESGERATMAERHFAYVHALFSGAAASFEGSPREDTVFALATELEDLRVALDWAATQDPSRGADLLTKTRLFPYLGLYREGIERAERFATLLEGNNANLLARLWTYASFCAQRHVNRKRAFAAAESALSYARSSGNATVLADALVMYGSTAASWGRFSEAEAAFIKAEAVEAPTLRRELDLLRFRALLTYFLSSDPPAARQAFEHLRSLHKSLGNMRGESAATISLAELEHARGETRRAIALASEALSMAQRLQDTASQVHVNMNLTAYLLAVDDHAAARIAGHSALQLFAKSDPYHTHVVLTLEHLALACALKGDFERAARLEGYADNALRAIGAERERTETITHERLAVLLKEHFSAVELRALLAAGAALMPGEAIAEGLA